MSRRPPAERRPRTLVGVALAALTVVSLGLMRLGSLGRPATATGKLPDRYHDEGQIVSGSPYEADRAPGDEQESGSDLAPGLAGYTIGLGLAILLTIVSFAVAETNLVWVPSIPIALAVLAVAQMGVHLVFFLHIGSGPDSTNNIMALAFGVLIVFLLITGSLWIMAHLNHTMMPMDQIMKMQR